MRVSMDRVILFKIVGLALLVIGVFMFIAGLLMANKFFEGTGFMSAVVAVVLLYYSMSVTPQKDIADEMTDEHMVRQK